MEFAIVASGALISGDVNLHDGKLNGRFGIHGPTVESCQAFLQVSFDTTSANFQRLAAADFSGDLTWLIGPGSNAMTTELLAPWNFCRVELDVAQTDNRSFAIVTRP